MQDTVRDLLLTIDSIGFGIFTLCIFTFFGKLYFVAAASGNENIRKVLRQKLQFLVPQLLISLSILVTNIIRGDYLDESGCDECTDIPDYGEPMKWHHDNNMHSFA